MPKSLDLTCAACYHRAPNLKDLERHWSIHLKHYCEDESKKVGQVAVSGSKKDQLPCKMCSFKTRYNFAMQKHIQTVHKMFQCSHCKYTTSKMVELSNHIKTEHDTNKMSNEVTTQNVHTENEKFKCPKCEFGFALELILSLRGRLHDHVGAEDGCYMIM